MVNFHNCNQVREDMSSLYFASIQTGPLYEYKEKDNTPFAEVIRENGSVYD